MSLSPNLGDLCGRKAVQGQTSSARTDGIIVTYIDEHVIGDDEKHKDADLGRFGDGQKLPPKIIVFDPGIDLCGSRAENGSYTPTSTQLSIAFPSGFGESIEGKPGKPDTEYAMSSKTIDGPYIEHIAIEVDDIEVKGIYLDAHIDVFLSSEEEFDKKFTDRTVKESLMSSFAGAKKLIFGEDKQITELNFESDDKRTVPCRKSPHDTNKLGLENYNALFGLFKDKQLERSASPFEITTNQDSKIGAFTTLTSLTTIISRLSCRALQELSCASDALMRK